MMHSGWNPKAGMKAWGIKLPTFRLGVRLQKRIRHCNHSATEDATYSHRAYYTPVTLQIATPLRGCRKEVAIGCTAVTSGRKDCPQWLLISVWPFWLQRGCSKLYCCQCILTVYHILARFPHLPPVTDDVFWNENVMESFRFHPELIIQIIFSETAFYQKFIFRFLARSLLPLILFIIYRLWFHCWSCMPFWHAFLCSFLSDVIKDFIQTCSTTKNNLVIFTVYPWN